MTDKELMAMALDALDIVKIHYTQNRHINEAIAALKERLAQPEQEPLGYIASMALNDMRDGVYGEVRVYHEELGGSVPIYTTPPQRTEPICPKCKAKVLYECVACSTNNYPPPQRTEQNFCPRCGKRTKDMTHIHTCTPPQDNT